MTKNLVIVESPAKTKTLSKILGRSYSLKASMGHIRDLPRSKLGVDVANSFAPQYVVPRAKSKTVAELKQAVKAATTVYLATDPDREGEAIAWHLAEVTRSNGTKYLRVTFNEITEEAIKEAFQHPRAINMHLVNAQQARRVLDRLLGYRISPLLWRKVKRGLSAGRVQSVAVKIIVDRELEIKAFVPVEYWNIEAELAKAREKASFKAGLVGLMDGTKLDVHTEAAATGLKEKLEKAAYSVAKDTTKKVTRQPAPPFITSTLQQEAWRKLHFTAKQTMAVAQELYEGLPVGAEGNVGLITYMRTDSTRVAQSAIAETREYIGTKYGKDFLPAHARAFTRTVKGAQEAHEAIRPTRTHREPALVKSYLSATQFKLYDLIWKRMVASQMAAALFDSTTADIEAKCSNAGYLLRASSLVNTFPGFIILYSESKDEAEEENKTPVPLLRKGDKLDLLGISAEQHFTQPPPRYTEATLIKTLEQFGIGRPSTYAPIISTIQEREYVTKVKGAFQPTELGMVVNDLLKQYFSDIVDIKFTATMEDELDDIVRDGKDWVSVVQELYNPLEKDLAKAQLAEKVKLADEVTSEVCPKCGKPMIVKTGRFGKFLACSGYPECKSTMRYQIKTGAKCPKCGGDIVQKISKRKKIFYGCANYPKCDFALFQRPLPEPCPQCGGLLVQRGQSVTCTKCQYRAKLSKAADA